MANDVGEVRGFVSRFWLNVPGPGASCPSCGRSRPDDAVQLLELLDGGSLAYPTPSSGLAAAFPAATSAAEFGLDAAGASHTWTGSVDHIARSWHRAVPAVRIG